MEASVSRHRHRPLVALLSRVSHLRRPTTPHRNQTEHLNDNRPPGALTTSRHSPIGNVLKGTVPHMTRRSGGLDFCDIISVRHDGEWRSPISPLVRQAREGPKGNRKYGACRRRLELAEQRKWNMRVHDQRYQRSSEGMMLAAHAKIQPLLPFVCEKLAGQVK